ncbi:MAG: phosphodiesterase [Alphaproteobacteria bacterium]|nr:phosphodiesterase [Alphaproteobacteria bacterium]
MLIAHLSDSHIGSDGTGMNGAVDTLSQLEKVVQEINNLPVMPDVALFTGDLTENGCYEGYKQLRGALEKLSMPCYLTTGNHDSPEAMKKAFNYKSESPYLQYAIELYPLRLIALDTYVPNQIGGRLCSERLEWLQEKLSEQPEKPTIIFMHHPPFLSGIPSFDKHLLEGAEELGEIVEKNPQIKRILCGHLHRSICVDWHGTIVNSAPSIAAQIVPDFSKDSNFAITSESASYLLHLWQNDTLISHVCSIPCVSSNS